MTLKYVRFACQLQCFDSAYRISKDEGTFRDLLLMAFRSTPFTSSGKTSHSAERQYPELGYIRYKGGRDRPTAEK